MSQRYYDMPDRLVVTAREENFMENILCLAKDYLVWCSRNNWQVPFNGDGELLDAVTAGGSCLHYATCNLILSTLFGTSLVTAVLWGGPLLLLLQTSST
jgi:hypothetical protein